MAPPRTSSAPLLRDLDPEAVAADVCGRVVDHLHSLAMRLTPAMLHLEGLDADRAGAGSDLWFTTRMLTLYAQRGLPVFDWESSGEAADACLDVFSALYSSAGDPHPGGGITEAAEDVEPDDAIGVVLLAAFARIKIDQRGPLVARELAVLSGLALRGVQKLIAAGEIAAKPDSERAHPLMLVRPAEAKRWLAVRGVPGFAR